LVQADAGDPIALAEALDRSFAHFERLDVLVSVAGLAIPGPLEAYPDDAFDRTFALNVRAPFIAAKKAATMMEAGGRIITIGSIVADRMPGGGGTLYVASKSALGGLTRGLARDLGRRGIRLTSYSPAPSTRTAIQRTVPTPKQTGRRLQSGATTLPQKWRALSPIWRLPKQPS
jgi:3-oxoacyl-[acyl-carrier protein] reductase